LDADDERESKHGRGESATEKSHATKPRTTRK